MTDLRSNEQKLVDLTFSMVLTLRDNIGWLSRIDRDDAAGWVRKQLYDNGFPTAPVGSAWGVLDTDTSAAVHYIAGPALTRALAPFARGGNGQSVAMGEPIDVDLLLAWTKLDAVMGSAFAKVRLGSPSASLLKAFDEIEAARQHVRECLVANLTLIKKAH